MSASLNNKIRWLFILCGGKFYLDWILPTNPMSKNKFINLFWGGRKCGFWWKYEERIIMCYTYAGIHIPFAIMNLFLGSFWSLGNILINVYPILVQLYIGNRCYRIKRLRNNTLQQNKVMLKSAE